VVGAMSRRPAARRWGRPSAKRRKPRGETLEIEWQAASKRLAGLSVADSSWQDSASIETLYKISLGASGIKIADLFHSVAHA